MNNILKRTLFFRIYKNIKANLAGLIYGNPSNKLFVIGITGTDGKTTTVKMLHNLLNNILGKVAMITSTKVVIGDEVIFDDDLQNGFDIWTLQKMLFFIKEKGCKYVVVEVDSIGLDQFNFHGIEFDMGLLTNLSEEHLDHHGDTANYLKVKKTLFDSIVANSKKIKYGVFPSDNNHGRKWQEEIVLDNTINFGIVTSSVLKASIIKESSIGTQFNVKYLGKDYHFNVTLLGRHNVYNILAAIGACLLIGIKIEDIISLINNFLSDLSSVNIIEDNGVKYYFDTINSLNSFEGTLRFINEIKGNSKSIIILGVPGKSDKYKRPILGKIAENYGDCLIITEDDSYEENRYKIIQQIVDKVKRHEGDDFYIIPERGFALNMALEIGKPGDIVFISSKKNKNFQYTNFGVREWNDEQKLLSFLKKRKLINEK